jgi:hypothetical protein
MSSVNLKKSLLRLPKWAALILGFGALFAGDARADKSQIQPPSSRLGSNLDEVLIRTEGEKIYISQGGGAFEELSLGNAPEAAYFRELLRDASTVDGQIAVPIGPIIVANGGSNNDGAKPKQPSKKKTGTKQAPTTDPGTGK